MMVIKHLSRACFFIILIAFVGGCSSKKSKNVCEGVTCSDHGTCAVENGSAKCNCNICYLANKLECVLDSSVCSGHGMCVDNNGTATCQCDTGYHLERLFCIENTPTCLEQCNGTYCLKNGYKTGYLCDTSTKLCTQCSQDNQCIAHTSGWWGILLTRCSKNNDCCTDINSCNPLEQCLDMGEVEQSGGKVGKCVVIAQSDNDCKKMGYGWSKVQRNDIDGTPFSVCAFTDTKCVTGNCVMNKECDSKADCIAKTNSWMPRCFSNGDCDAGVQACIQIDTNKDIGYCAITVCVSPLVEIQMPLFNASDGTGNVTVCSAPHGLDATCDNGTCNNPCKDNSYCIQTQSPSCDTTTGRCICITNADCKPTDYPGFDTCVGGSCGCSPSGTCPSPLTKLYDNTTWVCAIQ